MKYRLNEARTTSRTKPTQPKQPTKPTKPAPHLIQPYLTYLRMGIDKVGVDMRMMDCLPSWISIRFIRGSLKYPAAWVRISPRLLKSWNGRSDNLRITQWPMTCSPRHQATSKPYPSTSYAFSSFSITKSTKSATSRKRSSKSLPTPCLSQHHLSLRAWQLPRTLPITTSLINRRLPQNLQHHLPIQQKRLAHLLWKQARLRVLCAL